MKHKDIALVIVVVFLSGIASLVISKLIITTPSNRQEKVEVVQPITADFKQADTRYFNAQSINPTQLITIGNDVNNEPFKSN